MSQYDEVLQHLKKNGYITSWDAIQDYGITRLSAVIYRLRKANFRIISEEVPFTARNGEKHFYSKYILEEN